MPSVLSLQWIPGILKTGAGPCWHMTPFCCLASRSGMIHSVAMARKVGERVYYSPN